MACESSLRARSYAKTGCNAFDLKRPHSTPIAFWTENDVLEYIRQTGIEYASVYGEIVEDESGLHFTGEQRTGCMFCMFGIQLEEEPNRFQRMKETHPKQYEFCMNKLGLSQVLDYIGVNH